LFGGGQEKKIEEEGETLNYSETGKAAPPHVFPRTEEREQCHTVGT
jgi:hypothetical protein